MKLAVSCLAAGTADAVPRNVIVVYGFAIRICFLQPMNTYSLIHLAAIADEYLGDVQARDARATGPDGAADPT